MAHTSALGSVSTDPSRRRQIAEFWFYFSENRGAVIGLVVFALQVLRRPRRVSDDLAQHLRQPREDQTDFAHEMPHRRGPFAATG